MERMKKKNYPLYEVEPFDDFRQMLETAADKAGYDIAFRFRDGGAMRSVTYGEFLSDTRALGSALFDLDVQRAHIAAIGGNSYPWLTAFYTTLCSPGAFLPLDRELPFDEVLGILRSGDAEVVFLDAELLPKFRRHATRLPSVRYFIVFGMDESQQDERFLSYKAVLAKGKALLDGGLDSFLTCPLEGDDLRMLVYTSGTTGTAKGVMLSQKNLVASVLGTSRLIAPAACSLSVLPYHHTYESVSNVLATLGRHATVCINESLRTVMANFKIYKPDSVTLVPLFVENLYKNIWNSFEEGGKSEMLRKLIQTSQSLRKAGIDKRRSFFSTVHEAFGGNLKRILCVGAPLRAELADFFDAVGITILSGYGLTECASLVATNRDLFANPETVGVILPGNEVRIDNPAENGEGEILVKGDIVMIGYYNDRKTTKASFDENGYFRTGDVGYFGEKDQLIITGRCKNKILLPSGKSVYPEEIESYLMESPYVSEAVVYGKESEDGSPLTLVAELYLSEDTVRELTASDRLKLMTREMEEINRALPSYKRIRAVRIRKTPFEKTGLSSIRRSDLGTGASAERDVRGSETV